MERNMSQAIKPGDANQITRDYFDSLLIEIRHIDSIIPSTAFELYGEMFSTPIMTAALSHLDRVRPNGMTELAKGAFAANAVMWAGMTDDYEIESITATGAKTIEIIKPYADNNAIFKKIEHAEKCGVFAVGMDIDHAFDKKGKHGNVLGHPMSPKTLDDLKSYIRVTKLPFIVKGVLSESDACKCIEAGARGIVISHHHGILDYAVPPLMVLPKIAKIVGHEIPVFVDCCVSSGIDAFKALALGASAVSVGRALMDPLRDDGEKGVYNRIKDMTEELAGAMARTCSPDITHIDPAVIWKRDF